MTDWNVDALKEHTDSLFSEFSKGVDYRFESIKQAIEKSDGYAKYRDEKQNEFRGTIDDMNDTLARKTELDSLEKQFNIWMSGIKQVQEANFDVVIDKVGKCEKIIERIENIKRGNNAVYAWIVTGIMTLIAIGSFILNFIK